MAIFTKLRQWLVAIGLVLLVIAAGVGLYVTRNSGAAAAPRTRRPPLVNEQPLLTARSVAKLASSAEEQRYAQQALKLGDHEVDLTFADALRDTAEHPAPSTAESKELYSRVAKAEAAVKAGQDRIDQLKKQLASASGARQDNLQQQLSIVQAQMELDQDEVDDAKEDLIRSGADPQSRIQRQFARHEAAQQSDAAKTAGAPPSSPSAPGNDLVSQFGAWRALNSKREQLVQAQKESNEAAAQINQAHDALEKQINSQKSNKQALTQKATAQLDAASDQPANSSGDTAAALSSLHSLSVDQKDLADLDKRIQDHQELSTNYGNWIDTVESNQVAVLHSATRSLLWITLILLVVYFTQRVFEHFLTDLAPEQVRFRTLRIIVRFGAQAVGLVLILFVIFGAPAQTSTILGLTTAGLTVALKDFIVAFIGWFVLMGRNGIRAGDWVEINGVVGEVLEVTLLRTVMLETGNWTDTGHPTGRKVAFMNGYAIEGHFFNFSTAGQWLWDEMELIVPADQDPYPVIEAIQKLVANETAEDAKQAEKEWDRATSRYRVRAVSATPAVNLRPTGSGVEVHIRYITRAQERYATRAKLYEALVELLHGRGVKALPEPNASAATAKS